MVILPLLQSLGNQGGELKSMTENDPILDVYERFKHLDRQSGPEAPGASSTPPPGSGSSPVYPACSHGRKRKNKYLAINQYLRVSPPRKG